VRKAVGEYVEGNGLEAFGSQVDALVGRIESACGHRTADCHIAWTNPPFPAADERLGDEEQRKGANKTPSVSWADGSWIVAGAGWLENGRRGGRGWLAPVCP